VSDRTGGWEIYVTDAQGGHVEQLTSFGNAVADGVRWSPDGREIAFAVVPQGGNRDIYVAPADGGTVRRMNNDPSDEGRPSFSMDGKWIYFRSNRSGKDEIWKMPRGGGAATQVTHRRLRGPGNSGWQNPVFYPRASRKRLVEHACGGRNGRSRGWVGVGFARHLGSHAIRSLLREDRSAWDGEGQTDSLLELVYAQDVPGGSCGQADLEHSSRVFRLARWEALLLEPDRSSRCRPGAGGELLVNAFVSE